MDLQEQVFSVLIISASQKFNKLFVELLSKTRFSPVSFADNLSTAKRMLIDNSYDIVIINSPLSDGNGTDLAIDLSNGTNTGVLLFAKAEIYEIVCDEVYKYGVLTLAKPTSSKFVVQAVNILCAIKKKIEKQEKKTLSIEEKMNEIRIVNRAKWLLIDELKMSEEDAHKYIEKQAMDNCVSKKAIAQRIINTYG